jgi:uncharacterized DUF497 family protein
VRFEWDAAKAKANLIKHGVSFEEAASSLLDPKRTIVIGASGRNRILFVVTLHHEDEEVIRIVSARRASPSQRRKYEEAP